MAGGSAHGGGDEESEAAGDVNNEQLCRGLARMFADVEQQLNASSRARADVAPRVIRVVIRVGPR